jgi:hypothetical protein
MRRILFIACALLLSLSSVTAQDFVSKFMMENKNDTLLHCTSIGPKMMEAILKMDAQNEEQQQLKEMISQLKSVRIVNSKSQGKAYLEKAEQLIRRHAQRFTPYLAYDDERQNYQILTRKKGETIVELFLMDQQGEQFLLIDFVGQMDEEFIEQLTQVLLPNGEHK